MQHYCTLAQSLLYYDDGYISLFLYLILQVSLMANTWFWTKISEAYAFNHYQADMSYLPGV